MKKTLSIAVGALLLSASMASAIVIDNFDNVGDSHSGWRSTSWSEPDTLTNNSGDTRGGQSFGYLDTVDASSLGLSDASGSSVQMVIALTENAGNELHSLGKIMLADSEDRRWLFYFDDNILGGTIGNATAIDTPLTLTSNASSGRDTAQGLATGEFNWASIGKGVSGGQAYWIQLFDVQVNGGADPINLTFDSMSVIPEPATLGMVAVFGGGILFIRRRFMI